MGILVTGATGNVGLEIISQLKKRGARESIIAGVRDIEKAKVKFGELADIACVQFDFEDTSRFADALENVDTVFLLRPPHISNIKKYFEPLIKVIAEKGIRKVVLLSVQGAEQTTVIPHRKIELLIQHYGLEYIFMRPSYFMQNLTTTLYPEIRKERRITLPSGNAKFNWVDIADIAELGAEFLLDFDAYKNKAYTISGNENLAFSTVVFKINEITGSKLKYRSVNPVRYYFLKRKEKLETGMILVMLVLHFLPRLQGEPEIVHSYAEIMKKPPATVASFIERNRVLFI